MAAGIDCPNINHDLPILPNKSVILLFANSISALVFVCCISEFYDIQTELKHCGESSIYPLCTFWVDLPESKKLFINSDNARSSGESSEAPVFVTGICH